MAKTKPAERPKMDPWEAAKLAMETIGKTDVIMPDILRMVEYLLEPSCDFAQAKRMAECLLDDLKKYFEATTPENDEDNEE